MEMGAPNGFDLEKALAATSHSEFDEAVFPLYQVYGYKDIKVSSFNQTLVLNPSPKS